MSMTISGIDPAVNKYMKSQPKYGTPNWDVIPHKGMSRPSDAEMDKLIDEYARKMADAANAGDDIKYRELSDYAHNQLRAQYMSAVSPDRKSLVEEALQFINTSAGQTAKKGKGPHMTLVDILNVKEGLIKLDKYGNFAGGIMESGAMVSFEGGLFDPNAFVVKLGQEETPVIGWNRGEWQCSGYTDAESRARTEFFNRLNSAEEGYRMLGKAYGTTVSGKEDFTKLNIIV